MRRVVSLLLVIATAVPVTAFTEPARAREGVVVTTNILGDNPGTSWATRARSRYRRRRPGTDRAGVRGECRVGLLLGVMLAAVGLVVGTILVDLAVATAVALSLILICSWAAMIGATMPLLAKRLGIDPAVISAPLVTTLVDATGLIIYFLIAHAVLNL